MQESSPGLRERKRAQTSTAIHLAAAELVLLNGLDATTIDAISARAEISPRTFFNYFPSKEDAVLGIDEVAVASELAAERDYAGDPVLAIFDLIYDLFEASGGRQMKSSLKRDVLTKYPELLGRQMSRVSELEDRFSAKISDWLALDPRFSAESESDRLEQARLLLGISMAAVKISVKKWAAVNDRGAAPTDTPHSSPNQRDAPRASADPRATHEHAITLLRTVLEKIS